MKNNKGQNTMTEKVDNITYALVKQNDGSLKKVNYEEYKQEKALENLKKKRINLVLSKQVVVHLKIQLTVQVLRPGS